jgi:hypothetical protein
MGEASCSFCGLSQREAKKLLAGPTVYICEECIGLCVDILAEDRPEAPTIERELARLRKEKIEALTKSARRLAALDAIEREIASCRKETAAPGIGCKPCAACGGTGHKDARHSDAFCSTCNGSGSIEVQHEQ